MWINGVEKILSGLDGYGNATAAVMNLNTTSSYNSRIKQLSLGYFPGSTYSQTFKGQMSEVFIFGRKLTTTETNQMNAYLLYKYGIRP